VIECLELDRQELLSPVVIEATQPLVPDGRVLHFVSPKDRATVLQIAVDRDAQVALRPCERDERRQYGSVLRPAGIGPSG
jgi:hypothetical protein